MATELQIQANQLNTLNSTGPKNTSKTRFNAVKHGLLAKNLLIYAGEGQEDPKPFFFVLNSLRAELEPEGVLHEMLVERIAVSYYRLHLVILAEKGLRRELLDNYPEAASKEYDRYLEPEFDHIEKGQMVYNREKTDEEIDKEYRDIDKQLEELNSGQVNFGKLRAKYGDYPEAELLNKRRAALDEHSLKLDFIVSEKDRRFGSILDITNLTAQVPLNDRLDRLQRYETTVERQFYRALNQLMQLKQAQRIGFVSQKIVAVREEHSFPAGSMTSAAVPLVPAVPLG